MFRCHRCGEVAPPRTPATEVVLEKRPRTYPPRRYRLRGDRRDHIDPGGVGVETLRAVRVCPRCA